MAQKKKKKENEEQKNGGDEKKKVKVRDKQKFSGSRELLFSFVLESYQKVFISWQPTGKEDTKKLHANYRKISARFLHDFCLLFFSSSPPFKDPSSLPAPPTPTTSYGINFGEVASIECGGRGKMLMRNNFLPSVCARIYVPIPIPV